MHLNTDPPSMLPKSTRMVTDMKVKKEIILGTVKASTFIQTEVTTLETGWREKCKEMDSSLTWMVILSTKASGEMITLREKASSTTILIVMIGSSLKGSSGLEIRRDSGSCFTRMETGTKGNLEITYCGVRAECLVRTVKSSKRVYGKRVYLYLNCDLYFSLLIYCLVDWRFFDI